MTEKTPDDVVKVSILCDLSLRNRVKACANRRGVGVAIYAGWLLVSKLDALEGKTPTTLEEFVTRMSPVGGYLYLIRAANGLYKIGKAVNPKKRLSGLRCVSPVPLAIEHTVHVEHMTSAERAAHAMFADKRTHGEWFALAPRDVRLFKTLTADALCGSAVGNA